MDDGRQYRFIYPGLAVCGALFFAALFTGEHWLMAPLIVFVVGIVLYGIIFEGN